MKKIIITGLIGLLPALLMAQPVALNNKGTAKPNFTSAGSIAATNATGNTAKSAKVLRKEARETRDFYKTIKAFNRDFNGITNVQWTTDKNQFVASFTKEGVRNNIWYSKGGNMLYSLLSYGPDKLPAREQQVVRNEYRDFKITSVDEVHQNNITVYVVHLENDRNIKLITICDGAANEYRSYKKM